MLQLVLDSAGLDAQTCAGLLGISPSVFAEWSAGQRPIPESMLPLLSAVFSVPPSVLRSSPKAAKSMKQEDVTPAIWFKFRGPELVDADRECVVLIRQLGHYLNELEAVTRSRSMQWKTLFASIRNNIDLQAAPREQGRSAARMFREGTSLAHGQKGSGEVLRGLLRSLGVLVFETPLKESRLEGCSFSVGAQSVSRPCVFANTHHVTWFRRNMVLMHEIGHAIFESTYVGASLDFLGREDATDPLEMRAQAFAQECLVPKSVLVHVAQTTGIKWANLSARSLARLVADTHVEQRTVINAGVEAGLIEPEIAEELKRVDISDELRELSQHALSTDEYLELIGSANAKEWIGKRTTTLTPRPLRLPVGYVTSVVDAYKGCQISLGKAAEYLMVDDSDFVQRFGDIYAGVEE
jgi:Zn-dependent peptidase ImmA (M78 family)/transcriptional regulator with XRE-family HTH domain